MENNEYIRGFTNGFGATLIISDSDAIPNIDNGIAVSSALETQVGLRLIHISRIGKPYGECTELSEFKKKYNVTYERTTCQKFCEAKSVMDTCNCSSFFSEEVNLKLGKQRTIPGVCRTATELECLIGARKKFERGQTECQCGDPCTETIYEKFISSRAWPSDDYAKLLLDVLCEKTGTSACTTLYNQYTASQLAQNFIKLNIYYEDLNYQNITEKEDYEDVQFISDIGGTIGLWIGLSILSIFEVLQFFGELIRYGGRCGRTQNN
ncbi:hypothetical protein SNE40_023467 [Patella caerulea]|uniref:Uncharacterized protein n=1 Tax=Patella caerulea TaxID=87958 RepID=A0AAN8GC34_PATCE